MEYEILDEGEDVLFDDSTNPSLRPDDHQAHPLSTTDPHADPADRRKLQKAELIPEEEPQLA